MDQFAEKFEKTKDKVERITALGALVFLTQPMPRPLSEHTCDVTRREFEWEGKPAIRLDPECEACRTNGRMGLRVTRARKHLERLGPLLAELYLKGA
jgi:hypothetical protein